MHTIRRTVFKLALALSMLSSLLGVGLGSFTAAAAPSCSSTGSVSYDLYAKGGTVTLFGTTTANIWGYTGGLTGSNTGATDPAALPGVPLIVDQGNDVTINFTNQLGEPSSILFQGQEMIPDLTGAAAGGSKSYTFRACNPGTFLYEAGLLPNAQHQVAMGLYGTLIVRPAGAPTQAYADPSTAFTKENVMVLSELDTALNNSATPSTFDMRKYSPKYFLINGKAFPGTAAFDVVANDTVLMRYVNAGLQAHAMSTLGLAQTILAQDGSPYAHSHKVVAETIATGQTLDTLVAIPSTAPDGAKYAVYDANMLLRNNSGTGSTNGGFGGMLTFLKAGEGSSTGFDTTGPATVNVTLPSNAVSGAVIVAVSATVTDVNTGNSNVTAAEYFIDTPGTNGSGTAMSGTFGTPSVNVSANIPAAAIGALGTGNHIVYIHGQDAPGNWGSFNQGVLRVDNTPPTVNNASVTPSRTNGSVSLSLSATATDTATGNSNIAAAEYWIDSGSPSPMTVVTSASQSGISATIPAGTVAALAEGNHAIHIHAKDATNGVWGPDATVPLIVDKSGPNTSGVLAEKNPNNGALPYNTSVPAVRVSASFADATSSGVSSTVAGAEGFIDTVGANGAGFVFTASDGIFNSGSETGYADIPLAVVNSLSVGNHTIYVHAKDAAGNWGATSTTILLIDKTAPTVVSIDRADANPTSATSVNFTVTFSENVSGVAGANFSLVQGGGLTGAAITSVSGTGTTRTVTVSTGSGGGTLGLNLTSPTGITDIAGNTLSSTGLPFVGQVYTLLTPPLYFSTSGSSTVPGVGGTADDADIYYWDGAAFSRVIDATLITNPLPGNANVDGFIRVDATHFYMSFSGNVTIALPGPDLSVADEDVVYYNAGTWSLFFDGSAHGLATNSFDLDAISIVGGTLYFSTDNGNVPPGAGGTGDDADIYRWNGGSSYTRVVNANGAGSLGLPTGANVDGLKYVDATHFYLSFSGDLTVPGLGTVQDEDVVYYNNGTWSVYFDGTGKGLTSSNLDVDAFDLP
jgi:FtsP/CotA-like multicopper oxidase with cupredoxin domain